MRIPESVPAPSNDLACKLNKALYGLKQPAVTGIKNLTLFLKILSSFKVTPTSAFISD